MQFGYTILYVPDVKASLAFYQNAFGFQTRFVSEGAEFGELETGSTRLAFCSRALLEQMGKTPQAPDADRPCSEIALCTPDVAAALERAVAAGATLKQSAQTMSWGQTVAYVADPDGFLIELCTPMG